MTNLDPNIIADLIAIEVAATDNLSRREQRQLEEALRRLLASISAMSGSFDSQGNLSSSVYNVVAESISMIIVRHADHKDAQFFPVSNAGLVDARAACRQYDDMYVPPAAEGDLTVDFDIPTYVTVNCAGTQATYFTGLITLDVSSFLRDASVKRNANSTATLYGIIGPASGKAFLNTVSVVCDQNGSGDSVGLKMNAGEMDIRESFFDGDSAGGDGYGITGGGGTCNLSAGTWVKGTTAPTDGDEIRGINFDTYIKLLDSAGALVQLYPATDAGVTAALTAAASGDVVDKPVGTITGGPWTVGSGILLRGKGWNCILSGALTNNGRVDNVQVVGNVINNGSLNLARVAVSSGIGILQTTDNAITRCAVETSGTATHGISITDGKIYHSTVGGSSPSGIGILVNGSGTVLVGSRFLGEIGGQIENIKYAVGCTFRGLINTGGLKHTTGTGMIISSLCLTDGGVGNGLNLNAGGLTFIDVGWDSVDGSEYITYGQGDRGAYSVEDYHAEDIEDSKETRHTPAPVAQGDMQVADSNPYWSVLTVGGANEILQSDGTDPAWVAPGALGIDFDDLVGDCDLADLADYTRGDLIVGGSADWEDLAVGGAGAILKTDGTDVLWTTGVTVDGDQQMLLEASGTTKIPLTIKAAASQSANLQEWQDSNGAVMGGIQARGTYFSDLNTSSGNLFIGVDAGDTAASGNDNTVVGWEAGERLTSGGDNTFVGKRSGRLVTEGDQNFCGGSGAGRGITTGNNNFMLGDQTGANLGAGNNNVAIGVEALKRNVGGNQNVVVGQNAMRDGTLGDSNVAIGQNAGQDTNGDSNIYIGDNAGALHDGSNTLFISNSNTATPLIYGEFDNDLLRIHGDAEILDPGDLAGESLNEGDFASHANWDVTFDFTDDVGNVAEWTWSANQTSLLTQTDGGNLAIDGVADSWYKFVYTVDVTTAPDGDAAATITTAFAASAQTLELTAGTHTLYFKSAAAPTDFIISIVSGDDTEGQLSYDDLSLKQVVGGDFRVNGTTHLGDGANYTEIDNAGDLTFVGGAGLQFGEIFVEGIDFDILLEDEDVYVQVEAWSDGGGVDGEANGCIPDITNDHITVAVDGMYYVRWHVSCYSVNKNEYEFEVAVNGGPAVGTGFPNTEAYRTTSVASAVGAISGGGICDLAADDTVELWVERKDGGDPDKTLTIRQATLSLFQIGGT